MFLGSADIQMGVNESLEDTVRVVSSMSDALMLRMGPHEDIEVCAYLSSIDFDEDGDLEGGKVLECTSG